MSILNKIFGKNKQHQQQIDLSKEINERVKNMATTVAELENTLAGIDTKATEISGKLTEGFDEVTKVITDLRDELGNVQIPIGAKMKLDSIVAKMDSLKTAAEAIANIVPD